MKCHQEWILDQIEDLNFQTDFHRIIYKSNQQSFCYHIQ